MDLFLLSVLFLGYTVLMMLADHFSPNKHDWLEFVLRMGYLIFGGMSVAGFARLLYLAGWA